MINLLKTIQETKLQNILLKIRNALNKREEKILDDIDKQIEKKCCGESVFKEIEKLPKKLQSSLEKGKKLSGKRIIYLF